MAFNGGWQVRNPPNWPVNAGANNVGLAIVDAPTQVVGSSTTAGGDGGVFAIAASNGAQTWTFTGDAGDRRTAWSPSVATGGTVFFGDEGPKLTSVAIGSPTPSAQTTDAGISRGAPILGNDGTLYIADFSTNTISARNSTSLAPIWSVNNFNGSLFEASLALDCSRDGGVSVSRPGVLYAPDNLRNLFCFITDSHGIDFMSPWPKYQHDPRNTGNQQTPLSQFACP
jgi:outer membrane protein assembly factor BamB